MTFIAATIRLNLCEKSRRKEKGLTPVSRSPSRSVTGVGSGRSLAPTIISQSGVVMQRLSYPTETVSSIKITMII